MSGARDGESADDKTPYGEEVNTLYEVYSIFNLKQVRTRKEEKKSIL